MSVQDFFESDGFDQDMDVSASTRKFQQSIIIKQDTKKSGILVFLSEAQQETTPPPQQQSPQTMTPSSGQGEYSS